MRAKIMFGVMFVFSLQEAKIKDKQEPDVDVKNFLQTAYLHPSIVLAPMDSDSDDDPDTIKNGTAPSGNPETSSPEILKKKKSDSTTPSESTNKGRLDSPLRPASPHRHMHRETSGSSGNSRRRSKRLSGSHSPSFYDAGGYISSPALSRASSNSVYLDGVSSLPSLPRDEIASGSAWSSPHRAYVDETDRRHFTSPERPATLKHHRRDQTRTGSPPVLEVLHSRTPEALESLEALHSPPREGKHDRRKERESEPSFTEALQSPLGHVEP